MCKKLLFSLVLAMGALLPALAQQTLTVCDGEATNSNVPIFGQYVDNYLKC